MVPRSALAQYPFSPRSFQIGGHRLSYVDVGSGPAVVMVHGNPSWSYLYRNLITGLREDYRCIAPDHIGCGFSDKPRQYPYRLGNHIENLEAVLDYCGIERCVLIVHDWGGAIGMGWAGRHPERIAGLVVLNTAAFRSQKIPFRIAVCRWPFLGALLVRGFNGFARAAIYMAVTGKMRRDVASGFLAPYNSWANRIAIHRFVRDIPLNERHPSYDTLVQVENSLSLLQDMPMLICWGARDFCFNDHFYDEWRRRFPGAYGYRFEHAGHYVLEDALNEIEPLLTPFLASCHG